MQPFAQQQSSENLEVLGNARWPVCWAGAGRCLEEEVTLASVSRRMQTLLDLTGDMWGIPPAGRGQTNNSGLPGSQVQLAFILQRPLEEPHASKCP